MQVTFVLRGGWPRGALAADPALRAAMEAALSSLLTRWFLLGTPASATLRAAGPGLLYPSDAAQGEDPLASTAGAAHGGSDGPGGGSTPSPVPPRASPVGPIHVATSGADGAGCGAPTQPCATLAYAVNTVANSVLPLTDVVAIALGPGTFGPSSCGAVASRPLALSGAGSVVTAVNCGGLGRLLATNDSVTVEGVTVTGGWAREGGDDRDGGWDEGAAGGGAVSVQWASDLAGASANFRDVVFSNNHVEGRVSVGEAGTSVSVVGGGALWVQGGTGDAAVVVQACVFQGNSVNVTDGSGAGMGVVCGGGACISVGSAAWGGVQGPSWRGSGLQGPVSGWVSGPGSVQVTDCQAIDNSAHCGGGGSGACKAG